MNTIPYPSAAPPPPAQPTWFLPVLPPDLPPSSAFWEASNVHDRLRELKDTITLAKAMQKELKLLSMLKDAEGSAESADCESAALISRFSKLLEDRRVGLLAQESLSVEATNSLIYKLRAQLKPFRVVTDEKTPWEEKSAPARLANKMQKSKRNKLWRKRKRKRVAEMQATERERFDEADQAADAWRAREIAKDIATRKVEEMKRIARVEAKKQKKGLEKELELALIVEKLQELRSIRIQKLKKQGHFLPDEDDKFLEKVRAAVEEEERQAMAAADVDAAKDAIATAETRKILQGQMLEPKDMSKEGERSGKSENEMNMNQTEKQSDQAAVNVMEPQKQGSERPSYDGFYDSVSSLPLEFYHYYHGSNNDMGTLIEVRRQWDVYIRPGGSRIPGHWVQPPRPADEIWASYLVRPK